MTTPKEFLQDNELYTKYLQYKETKKKEYQYLYYLRVTKPNRAKKRKEKEKTIPVDTL
jgi:hypothetical protein